MASSSQSWRSLGPIGWLAVIAIIAGAAQSLAVSFWPTDASKTIDDIAILLLSLLLVVRLREARPWTIVFLALWCGLGAVALLHSEVGFSVALAMYRQILMPALLIFCGSLLKPIEWKTVVRVAVVVALLNCLYMPFELLGVRFFDLAAFNSVDLLGARPLRDGTLPGSYWYYWGDNGGQRILRAGGLFLNPPVMGIAAGTAFAVLSYEKIRRRVKIPLLVILGLGTVLTFSRAGILIAACGALLPILIRRLGPLWSWVIIGTAGLAGGVVVSQHGGSIRHLEGLGRGILYALTSPLGTGYGAIGNDAKRSGVADAGESLLGIAFSAGGLLMLVCVLCLTAYLAVNAFRGSQLSCLGLAGLAAAALSESAVALNASMLLWFGCGVAIREGMTLRPRLIFRRDPRARDRELATSGTPTAEEQPL